MSELSTSRETNVSPRIVAKWQRNDILAQVVSQQDEVVKASPIPLRVYGKTLVYEQGQMELASAIERFMTPYVHHYGKEGPFSAAGTVTKGVTTTRDQKELTPTTFFIASEDLTSRMSDIIQGAVDYANEQLALLESPFRLPSLSQVEASV